MRCRPITALDIESSKCVGKSNENRGAAAPGHARCSITGRRPWTADRGGPDLAKLTLATRDLCGKVGELQWLIAELRELECAVERALWATDEHLLCSRDLLSHPPIRSRLAQPARQEAAHEQKGRPLRVLSGTGRSDAAAVRGTASR
jgi:hypothetical protein